MSYLSPSYRIIENDRDKLVFDSCYMKSLYEYELFIGLTVIFSFFQFQ